jgi:hypothetical protein
MDLGVGKQLVEAENRLPVDFQEWPLSGDEQPSATGLTDLTSSGRLQNH